VFGAARGAAGSPRPPLRGQQRSPPRAVLVSSCPA
jgi:hypothetical protein